MVFYPLSTLMQGGIRDILELQMEYPGVYPFTNFVLGQLYWQQGLYKKSRSSLKIFVYHKFPEEIWKERALLLLEKMISEYIFHKILVQFFFLFTFFISKCFKK